MCICIGINLQLSLFHTSVAFIFINGHEMQHLLLQ